MRARDVETHEIVAIKTLARLDPGESYAFKREFRVLSRIVHPNLVGLYELHQADELRFFTMELVEGVDWDAATAARDREGRFHLALALIDAIAAIHDTDHVHGDLKPSNILVDTSGRLVVLDLGMARPMQRSSVRAGKTTITGTPAYMAPELLWGTAAGQRDRGGSDLYALGLLLFEMLCNSPAFRDGVPADVRRRMAGPPPRPSERIEIAGDLDALVSALLEPLPDRRPSLEAVQRAIQDHDGSTVRRHRQRRSLRGRATEITRIHDWIARACDGEPVLAFVSGPSGIGKSTVVEAALRAEESTAAVTVLGGRCHPGERVPFRAMDAVVDELALLLADDKLADMAVDASDVSSLVRLFPALRGVLPDAAVPPPSDPLEIRRRAFRGLRRALSGAAEMRPIVLWIDDCQWADTDSVDLIRSIMHPDNARVALVAAYRTDGAMSSAFSTIVARGVPGRMRFDLELHAMSWDAVYAMVEQQVGAADAARIADTSGGSPLFVSALLRHAGPIATRVSLQEVLRARVTGASPSGLALLEFIAALGAPMPRRQLLLAAGLAAAAALRELLERGLIAYCEVLGELAIEVSHDRVRAAVLGRLGADELATLHLRTARLLEAVDAHPRLLVEQLIAGGARARAVTHARSAAAQAQRNLAFALEAELRALVLDLDESAGADELEALALALERAGSGVRAADWWMRAAGLRSAGKLDGAPTPDDLSLRLRAGELLVRSGMVARGRDVLLGVLQALGVQPPRSGRAAMRAALWRRAKLMFRGLRFSPQPGCGTDHARMARLDALWGTATSLAMLDHVLADALCVEHLLGALALGEPHRALKALGYEAVFLGRFGAKFLRRRSLRLAERVREMAVSSDRSYDRAWAAMSVGTVHWLADRWQTAADSLECALRIWEGECLGVHFERSSTCAFLASSYYYLGRTSEFVGILERVINEIEALGNRFPLDIGVFDPLSIGALLDDDPHRALAWIDEAWATVPADEFRVARFTEGHTRARVYLYMDEPEQAWAAVEAGWVHVRAANVTWVESFRLDLRYRRAQVAAVLLSRLPDGLASPRARVLRRRIAADHRDLLASDLPVARPWADSLAGAVARIEGRDSEAFAAFSRAADGFAAADMPMFRIAARHEAARSLQDEATASAQIRALAGMGVDAPERFMRTLVPVVGSAAGQASA